MTEETIGKTAQEDRRGGAGRNRPIEVATLVLIAVGVLHDLDHVFNQPHRSIHIAVFVAAGLGWLALFTTLYLAHRGHRLAPHMALFTGLATAAGFIASHVAPDFSVFSDSFEGLGVNALSWVLVALPIAAGLVLAYVGGRQLAEGRVAASVPSPAVD